MRRYITTAIDYPNAPPHMGHVMEKVLADVAARWFRLRGDDVRFQIGTDEHGVKIQRTAEKEGITPKKLVDRNVLLFQELYRRLQIFSDDFIRTSDRARHWPTVEELWRRLAARGVLEKRKYTGLYCSGCEKFLTKKDLEDGKCPNHQVAPEEVKEENYFFLLSKETEWLKNLLTKEKGGYHIVPDFRANETLSLLNQGLDDVSFSRPHSSLSWGIPVPGDEEQTMYVWCDALTNYVSTLRVFEEESEEKVWWEEAEVTHVIGKDIARFHALIWPAMLKHAGLRTPDCLLIHGFLTSEGQKMSKSIGNVVEPNEVLERYGVDPLRFYLSLEIPVGNDGDFSWQRFQEAYDGKLRNTIGNLFHRVLVLLRAEEGELTNIEGSRDLWSRYRKAMDDVDLSTALQYAMLIAEEGNRTIDDRKPWALQGKERKLVLSKLAELLRHIALMLLPFLPETAQRMAKQLGLPYASRMLRKDFVIAPATQEWGSQKDWKTIGEPSILFPPL
jgi:methionyl-tRNA synthetase